MERGAGKHASVEKARRLDILLTFFYSVCHSPLFEHLEQVTMSNIIIYC